MVHAVNAGGEGQSIADFAVFEPTPDTMVEVHKTIVYENVADKNLTVIFIFILINFYYKFKFYLFFFFTVTVEFNFFNFDNLLKFIMY